jgi:precorrin-8X/cobalt-precorrin-8 methylmutase
LVTGRPGPGGPAAEAGPPPEAYRILRSRIDLSRLAPLSRRVTEHVIVASGDFDYATDLVCDEQVLAGAVAELAAGTAVVADAAMVAVGITTYPVTCKSEEMLTVRLARTAGISPAAAAVRLAFGEAGPGAIWVVGGEPAALGEIMARNVEPSLVIGMPAGLAGAAEAKDALRASGLPALTNISEKGGAAVAAAAFGALAGAASAQAGASARADDTAAPRGGGRRARD